MAGKSHEQIRNEYWEAYVERGIREEHERQDFDGRTVWECIGDSTQRADEALLNMPNGDFLVWEWLGYGWSIYLDTQGIPVTEKDKRPKDGLSRMSQTELSIATGLQKYRVAQSLKRLEEHGFIIKVHPPHGPYPAAYKVNNRVLTVKEK